MTFIDGYSYESLVKFDEENNSLIVFDQSDLDLIGEYVTVQVELETTDKLKLIANFVISYDTDGPWF